MTHLDPDRLADRALGTDDPLTSMRRIGCIGARRLAGQGCCQLVQVWLPRGLRIRALAVMRESPQLGCRRWRVCS